MSEPDCCSTSCARKGGNIGIIAVSTMMLHAGAGKCARLITVEPTPETFLFLRWNLHANGVPDITRGGSCGVLPVNQALTRDGRQVKLVLGQRSMNAHLVDAKRCV